MANSSDLNKLQDLFSRLSDESQDLVFRIIYALLPTSELPKGRCVFDVVEQEDSIEKLKQTGFVKTEKLDDFNVKEEPVKIISKQERVKFHRISLCIVYMCILYSKKNSLTRFCE